MNLKERLHQIIYEAETTEGKTFDIILIIAILLSVLTVMFDSTQEASKEYKTIIYFAEYFFTILFTVEYILRIYCIKKPTSYIFSFYGIVDLIAILPTYLMFFLPGAQFLSTIRILRVIRIFRVLKLATYLKESSVLMQAILASKRKITVFLFFIVILITFLGSLIYVIEGPNNGFSSIPQCIYWAIVTITTVGYGDLVPVTALGKAFASLFMIIGYGIIAVPTGIVTTEISKAILRQENTICCPNCAKEGHDLNAGYCSRCGHKL